MGWYTKKFITEEYCVSLTPNNFPTSGILADDVKVLFKNLPYSLLSQNLFIICRIYRVGSMDASDVTKPIDARKQSKQNIKPIMKPYGCTIFPLHSSMNDLINNLAEEKTFEPGISPIYCTKDENYFIQLPFDLISNVINNINNNNNNIIIS